jgi:hypothetical protein
MGTDVDWPGVDEALVERRGVLGGDALGVLLENLNSGVVQ